MPSQEERDRATAVRSMDDRTRVHAAAEDTDVVAGAGGAVRPVRAAERRAPAADQFETGHEDVTARRRLPAEVGRSQDVSRQVHQALDELEDRLVRRTTDAS